MNEVYKTIYVYSYVGEYELKQSTPVIDFYDLEEFNKELHTLTLKTLQLEEEPCYLHKITSKDFHAVASENSMYILSLLDRPYGVGADDGHYDYFPDLVDQFRQLCEQTDNAKLYNLTIKLIRSHKEYNAKDEEITFEEI